MAKKAPKSGKRAPRQWDRDAHEDTLMRALDYLVVLIAEGADPATLGGLPKVLEGGANSPSRATIYRAQKPPSEGGQGWSWDYLIDDALRKHRPYAYEKLQALRGKKDDPTTDIGELFRHSVLGFPRTAGTGQEKSLERYLRQTADLVDLDPVLMLRRDWDWKYCEAAIRLVRLQGNAARREDFVQAKRLWQKAATTGIECMTVIAPVVRLADELSLRRRLTRKDIALTGTPSRLLDTQTPEQLISPVRQPPDDEIEDLPEDSIEVLLTRFYLLAGETVYALTRALAAESPRRPTQAALEAWSTVVRVEGFPFTRNVDFLAFLVGSAAAAVLEAQFTAALQDPSKLDSCFRSALAVLGEEPSTEGFWPKGRGLAPEWSQTALSAAYQRELARLWMVMDSYEPDASCLKTVARHLPHAPSRPPKLGHPDPARLASYHEAGPWLISTIRRLGSLVPSPGTSKEVSAAQADLLTFVSRRLNEVNEDDVHVGICTLDIVPFRSMTQVSPHEGRGTSPMDRIDLMASGRDPESRTLGQDYLELLAQIGASHVFTLLPTEQQKTISDAILEPRGLHEDPDRWRDLMANPKYLRPVPLQAALAELSTIALTLEQGFDRGATIPTGDQVTLLRISRALLALQLRIGAERSDGIKPDLVSPETAQAARRYWQLLLKELQQMHGVTIDLYNVATGACRVVSGGTAKQQSVTMTPEVSADELRLNVPHLGRVTVIPLIGLTPIRLLTLMDALATNATDNWYPHPD